ncbi:MAG: hypothetical protein HY063_10590 [Bacteroidetes bacterium]|nr:hypothetical protein [Bacteroidota bacterium]
MEEEFKNIVTLPLTREPGGKERNYTFESGNIMYIKRGYYKSVKKQLCRIHFAKGFKLPDVAYSPLSMDDLMEIINASAILGVKYPSRFIRIPLKNHRDEKLEEKILDISTIIGIQFVWIGDGDTELMKLYIRDKENQDSILYTNLSGDEMDRAIEKSSATIN